MVSTFSRVNQSLHEILFINGRLESIVQRQMETTLRLRPAHRHQQSAVVQALTRVPVIIVVSMNFASHPMETRWQLFRKTGS